MTVSFSVGRAAINDDDDNGKELSKKPVKRQLKTKTIEQGW